MKIFPEIYLNEKDFYNLYELLEYSFSKNFKWHENFVLQLGVELLQEVRHLKCDYTSQTIADEITPVHIIFLKNGTLKLKMHLENFEHQVVPAELYKQEQLRYLPPEAHRNSAIKDERVVLYAIGVILYEVCAGKKIISAATPEEILHKTQNEDFDESVLIARGYSLSLIELIFSLLEKNIEKRLSSIEGALSLIDESLSKKQYIPETLLWDEIIRLKSAKYQSELLQSNDQGQRPRKKRRWTPFLRVKISLISLGVMTFCISVFLFTKQPSDLKLYFVKGRNAFELRKIGLQLNTGIVLTPLACDALVQGLLLAPSLYMIGDSEEELNPPAETQFSAKNFYQYSVSGAESIESKLAFFEEACGKSVKIGKSISIFKKYVRALVTSSAIAINDFSKLKGYLQTELNFSQSEMEGIVNDGAHKEELENWEESAGHMQFFDTHRRLGFDTLRLDDLKAFPKSVSDCQNLLDLYWIKKLFIVGQNENFFQQFDVLLIPTNYEVNLSKNIWEGLQISSEQTNIDSKLSGVCVYRRDRGVLQEISYREIHY